MADFFWLLNEQGDAVRDIKQRSKHTVAAQPPPSDEAGPAAAAIEVSEPAGPETETLAASAAEAVLNALACSAADVPAFLERRGLGESAAGDAFTEACSLALLAVLLLPSEGGDQQQPQQGQQPQPQPQQKGGIAAPLAAAAGAAAALHGAAGLMRRLLQLGADLSFAGQADGMSPLDAAVLGGREDAICALLEAGMPPDGMPAEVTLGGGQAETASTSPKRKRFEVVLPSGGSRQGSADPGEAAAGSRAHPTSLVLAVAAANMPVVERLLAAGADANLQCSMRLGAGEAAVALTPLIAAVHSGSPAMVTRLLAAGASVHRKVSATGGGDADWTSALSAAVLSGSADMVRLLVDAGACTGGRGGNSGGHVGRGHPALRAVALAAQRGRVDMIEVLYPPLVQALQGGSTAMVGTLCRRTALHPLAAAAELGQLAAVECLLALGAPPSHGCNTSGGVAQCTPLGLAAGNGHLPVVECLLAAGATALAKPNSREEVSAATALRNGHVAVARRLLEHTGEMGPAEDPATPRPQLANASKAWHVGFTGGGLSRSRGIISLAALERERQLYQLLVLALLRAHAGGSDAPAAVAEVCQLATPGALAHAAAGSLALLDAMLACGASLACVDPATGAFPLLAAAHHSWPSMQRLLQRGTSLHQCDAAGNTVLHLMASRPAMLETLHHLLSWHAAQQQERQGLGLPPLLDLQRANAEGCDAVGVALGTKNRRCAELLLEHLVAAQQGEQARHRDEQCAAAAAAAAASVGVGDEAEEGDTGAPAAAAAPVAVPPPPPKVSAAAVATKACDLLLALGAKRLADINKPFAGGQHLLDPQAAPASRKQLRLLLDLPGLDVNVRGAAGRTLLMHAAQQKQPGIVQDLLATGRADVGARDATGATALLLAARAGSAESMRLLLSAGADICSADTAGATPLMALAALNLRKLLSELLRGPAVACINRQDANGLTALHHAAAVGAAPSCRVLRSFGADPCLCTAEGKTAMDLAVAGGHALCMPFLKLPDVAACWADA